MSRYFFSYAGIDRPIAAQIVVGLQGAGIDVFWDQQGIGWGVNWQNKLAEELETCDTYILLLGPEGVRRWVKPEVQVALCRHYEQNLPIFILLHPGVDRSKIPLFLNFSQHRTLPVKLDAPNFFKVLVRELEEQVGKQIFEQVELPEGFCPYPGLESFTPDYANFFFGRQQETSELLTQFTINNQRWLQIEGNSGVGKSSLIQSGLLPAINAGWLDDDGRRRQWHIAIMRPGINPCENLSVALRTTLEGVSRVDLATDIDKIRRVESQDMTLKRHHTQPSDLAFALKSALPNGNNSRFLLVVDQLEEAITLVTSNEDRERFDALLATAIADPDCPFYLVTTIRSDFLLYFSELPQLQKALQQSTRYFLKPIEQIGLLDAVTTPLRRTKGWLWPSQSQYHTVSQRNLNLAETIVADALLERDAALPLASNLMNHLWTKALERGCRELSFDDYYALEGIGGALAQSLDPALGKLPDSEKSMARAVLLALVQDNYNVPDTRRSISKSQALTEATAVSQVTRSFSLKALPHFLTEWLRRYKSHSAIKSTKPEHILYWLSGIPVDEIKVKPVRMITIGGGKESESILGNADHNNDRKTVDLIHEVLLRKSRVNDRPYCKTLYQWLLDYRQQLKNRNLRQQMTQRWLAAKKESFLSAWFNDLANRKQLLDFRRAGSCASNETLFLNASNQRLRVFKGIIGLAIAAIISLSLKAGGISFISQINFFPTNLIDLPLAWLHARRNEVQYPKMLSIPEGSITIDGQSKVIPAFRMAETEVTFAEYDVFVFAKLLKKYRNLNYLAALLEGKEDKSKPGPEIIFKDVLGISMEDPDCDTLPNDEGWGRGSHPVINITWYCAQDYINWLNEQINHNDQTRFYLPSETQWEYARRGGSTGDDFPRHWEAAAVVAKKALVAWFDKNSNGHTHPVKQLNPNNFGLFDMAGNVWEWTEDCWNDDYQIKSSVGKADFDGNNYCTERVLRGSSWHEPALTLNADFRTRGSFGKRNYSVGFRLAQD